MNTFVELTKLQLLVWWRQSLMAIGRLVWFAIMYGIGKALFDSDTAASILGGIVAVMTYKVGVTDREVAESAARVTGGPS